MYAKPTLWAEVDDDGRMVLPADLADRYGVKPGSRLRVDVEGNSLRFHRPVTHLAKIYIETTNMCNINCRTCIRNDWDVELGQMPSRIFERVIESLPGLSPAPALVFVGMGEPLLHPDTLVMVSQAKKNWSPGGAGHERHPADGGVRPAAD